MPTKPSSWGIQEYVPAGNGDASGEYADDQGNNMHFTNFVNPDNPPKVEPKGETPPNTQLGENGGISIAPNDDNAVTDNFKSFNDYCDKNLDKELADLVKKEYKAGNQEQQKMVNALLSTGKFSINQTDGISHLSYYGVNFELNSIAYKYEDDGEVFYHEFGHAFDYQFSRGIKGINDDIITDKLFTDQDQQYLKAKYGYNWDEYAMFLSSGKVLSNGKTLHETIRAEVLSMNKKGTWDTIKREYEQALSDALEKAYPNYEEERKKYDEETHDIRMEAMDKYDIDYWNMTDEQIAKAKEDRKNYLKKKLEEKGYGKMTDFIYESKPAIEAKINQQYVSLSDMYGIQNEIGYGFCGGHKSNYKKKHKNALGMEFFAEYNSATARNSELANQELEMLGKYMPESIKMAKELSDIIHNACKEKGIL